MKKIIACILSLAFAAAFLTGCAPSAAQNAPESEEKKAIEIYIKQKTVTTETQSVMLAIINNTDKHYSFDYVQQLEIKNGDEYQAVPLTFEGVALALLHISGGETQDYEFDFANHYAMPLSRGSYRIVKTFVDDDGAQFEAVCEFDVL